MVHTSFWLQALPSSQGKAVITNAQTPVDATQLSEVQALPSSHTANWPGTHAPLLQMSPIVHELPSVQGALVATYLQPSLLSHKSDVHGLPSLQSNALPGSQWPAWHVSLTVQIVPSASHCLPSPTAT